jgi:hypothetical protein
MAALAWCSAVRVRLWAIVLVRCQSSMRRVKHDWFWLGRSSSWGRRVVPSSGGFLASIEVRAARLLDVGASPCFVVVEHMVLHNDDGIVPTTPSG